MKIIDLISKVERGEVTPLYMIKALSLCSSHVVQLEDGCIAGLLDAYEEIKDASVLAEATLYFYDEASNKASNKALRLKKNYARLIKAIFEEEED